MALVPKQTYIKDVIDQIKMFPNHNHVILVLSQSTQRLFKLRSLTLHL